MLANAIQYASKLHTGQRRKYLPVDYIQHPLQVMHCVATDKLLGGDDTFASVAVLHDVVEDCTGPTDEDRDALYLTIKIKFGTEVLNGVRALTNEFVKARYPNLNRSKRKAKEYKRLAALDWTHQLIKLYDRLVNLEDTLLCVEEERGFGKMLVVETVDLVKALMTPTTAYLASQVSARAAELQELIIHA